VQWGDVPENAAGSARQELQNGSGEQSGACNSNVGVVYAQMKASALECRL